MSRFERVLSKLAPNLRQRRRAKRRAAEKEERQSNNLDLVDISGFPPGTRIAACCACCLA